MNLFSFHFELHCTDHIDVIDISYWIPTLVTLTGLVISAILMSWIALALIDWLNILIISKVVII